ncbi:MAG: glycosyltransferase family 2 protein [Dissulfurispiraceae bacterium]
MEPTIYKCKPESEWLPLVSIVIPTYNSAHYLEDAINSVTIQDYPQIELIVLDDGSTDNTESILRKYNDCLVWARHPNMGQALTLNKGWKMSKGSILSYLSADDVLLPTAVSTSVKYLRANPETVLTYCDFNLIDQKSRIIRQVSSPSFSYHDLVVKQICQPGPGVFFRRKTFETVGGWDGSFRQMPDFEYWLRLGLAGQFLRIPEVLASFRVHDQSQTYARASEDRCNEPVKIISKFFEINDLTSDLAAAKEEALANAYLFSAQLHWRSGRCRKAIAAVFNTFRLYPRTLLSLRTFRIINNALFNRAAHKLLRILKGA